MISTAQATPTQTKRTGIACALLTVAIWGIWPVYTRFSLNRNLSPHDLVALRFGISGLLLLPLLLGSSRSIGRRVWIEGVLLASCQGAPVVLLLATGLKFAPANHAPVLTTGLMPLFAATLNLLCFALRTEFTRSIGLMFILLGVLFFVGVDLFSDSSTFFGDALFVCASDIASGHCSQ